MAAALVNDGLRALELLSELLFGRRDPKLYARPALIQAALWHAVGGCTCFLRTLVRIRFLYRGSLGAC